MRLRKVCSSAACLPPSLQLHRASGALPSAHTSPFSIWWLLPLTRPLLKRHLSKGSSRMLSEDWGVCGGREIFTPRAFVWTLLNAGGRRIVLKGFRSPKQRWTAQPDGARPRTVEPPVPGCRLLQSVPSGGSARLAVAGECKRQHCACRIGPTKTAPGVPRLQTQAHSTGASESDSR